jgi:hypothetical protein
LRHHGFVLFLVLFGHSRDNGKVELCWARVRPFG